MGIIRAATSAVGGTLADQWLEVIQADNMGPQTVMTTGVAVRRDDKRNRNRKGTQDIITDGSVIMVGQNQFMMLADGGKIIDFSAEPGYYTVSNSSAPSLFRGQFDEVLIDTFTRLKFGGTTPQQQKVYYINTQEITNIAFGTQNPINYFDNFYNAELYLRAHGYFSIRIVDPMKFFAEAVPRNASRVEVTDIHKMYLAEFLTALQTAIGKMSVDGIRISHISSKSQELASYMSTVLDEEWTRRRGMIIESVGIASITYDEQSKKLIDMRNAGAMLSDASIREGYVQGSVARGIEAAGSNKGGAVSGFMGVNMGMQGGGGFVQAAGETNRAQMQQQAQAQAADGWKCSCGETNSGNFCSSCGKPKPQDGAWTCSCGAKNSGNFCSSCGKKRETAACPKCSAPVAPGAKFCAECGEKIE